MYVTSKLSTEKWL